MDFGTIDGIRRSGFDGFVTVMDLQGGSCCQVPNEPGVYLILRPDMKAPDFRRPGTGGLFKGKDPNVEIDKLRKKWIEQALVLYIGKAGLEATLRSRLKQYMDFGQKIPIGHWGGRYIWQLQNSRDLLVCWKVTPTGALPRDEEQKLIVEFERLHGIPPFANLRH
jgi:hypothetical protein